MRKKIVDSVGMIIIGCIIVVLNFIVGANEKGLRIYAMAIMLIFVLFYLVIRKIMIKQQRIIRNKVDLAVLLFMCSTLLPLIFRTYSTYQGTVEFIIKYFFVYAIYVLVRNVVDSNTKVNALIWVVLAASLMIAVIGIDVQHQNILEGLLNQYNLGYTYSEKMVSSFGYANTVAIYFSFCIFLAIHQIQSSSKRMVKWLGVLYLILGFYVVLKTLSRAVFALLLGALLVYFIAYYLPKLSKHKKEIKWILGSGFLILILFFGFVFGIGVRVSKPYDFSYGRYQRNFNYSFQPSENYTMELEIEMENPEATVIVEILEINQYFQESVLVSKTANAKNHKVSLPFCTTENLYQIDLLIINQKEEKVSIQKCYINGTEYPMDYQFLPYQIGKAITMYSSNDKSVKQRMDFWKDCIKMAKDSPIIGQGGDTWKKVSQAVQDYPYGMKETHSYFFELLISFGIVGVVLYLLLMVIFHMYMIQNGLRDQKSRYEKLVILFGLDLIVLHSLCFDLNMSFLVILTTVFLSVGMLMYDAKEEFEVDERVDYLVFSFLGVILVILIMANVAQDLIEDRKWKKNIGFYIAYWKHDYINECIENDYNFRETLSELQNLMKKEPYFWQSDEYNKYWNQLLINLSQLKEEEIAEYVAFINQRYRKVKFVTPMYIDTILARVQTMQNAYLQLKEQNFVNENLICEIEELHQIIEEEYEVNKRNIEDGQRNGYEQKVINDIMKEYKRILNK